MSIQGSLNDKVRLFGSVNSGAQLVGTVHAGVVVTKELDYYDGSYEVRPTIEEQVLRVKEKTMSDDLTIEAIPYAEVTNGANGITVTIGP